MRESSLEKTMTRVFPLKDFRINRDLSWMEFNYRVLSEAINPNNPLLERVKFIQIFTTNLDEFFMKKVGPLRQRLRMKSQANAPKDNYSLELLSTIIARANEHLELRNQIWSEDISKSLAKEGILILSWDELTRLEKEKLVEYFNQNIFPVLTPLAVDPGHPFPFISNLSNSLGIILRAPGVLLRNTNQVKEYRSLFTRIKIPSQFNQFVKIPVGSEVGCDSDRFISLSELVSEMAPSLFPGMDIVTQFPFRITRNTEVEKNEELAANLLRMITEELKERRFGEPVRLEVPQSLDTRMHSYLKTELGLAQDEIFMTHSFLDFSDLSKIWSLPRPTLKYKPWSPVVHPRIQGQNGPMFDEIQRKDILVHHPYECFQSSVVRFIKEAVDDPEVLSIKMTLYRTGANSPFVPLLIRAAEAGKQVVALVELKAKFDEARNISVARDLEHAGVHVVYGLVGLKTHSKMTQVIRRENDRLVSYVHISTGNYNPSTSTIYSDLSFFTCDPKINKDVSDLFNFLTGRSLKNNYEKLLVAPLGLKTALVELIQQEVINKQNGLPAKIIAKMNALDDLDVISSLEFAASQGVPIELYVRGGVAINPRAPGVAENLKIISIVGRFLEHSRVMYFANGKLNPLDGLFFLGSADWMSRNLNSRVELMVPIEDPEVRGEIWDILQVFSQDSVQSWILNTDGSYSRNTSESLAQENSYSAQERFLKFYLARANRIVFLSPPQIQHGWQVFKEIERPKFD